MCVCACVCNKYNIYGPGLIWEVGYAFSWIAKGPNLATFLATNFFHKPILNCTKKIDYDGQKFQVGLALLEQMPPSLIISCDVIFSGIVFNRFFEAACH